MDIFAVNYNDKRHNMMFMKTLKFYEYFMFRNSKNMRAMIPHCRVFVELIQNRLPTAKILSNIFSYILSDSVRQKILKAVFMKVFEIAEAADVFSLKKVLT